METSITYTVPIRNLSRGELYAKEHNQLGTVRLTSYKDYIRARKSSTKQKTKK